jgi:hypothetical protein
MASTPPYIFLMPEGPVGKKSAWRAEMKDKRGPSHAPYLPGARDYRAQLHLAWQGMKAEDRLGPTQQGQIH